MISVTDTHGGRLPNCAGRVLHLVRMLSQLFLSTTRPKQLVVIDTEGQDEITT